MRRRSRLPRSPRRSSTTPRTLESAFAPRSGRPDRLLHNSNMSSAIPAAPFDGKAFVSTLSELARRLPHVRRQRRAALRRQGRQSQEARRQLFPEAAHGSARRRDDRADRAHRDDADAHRGRGAAARSAADQVAEAALQHRASRRQELSVHPSDARRISAARIPSRRARRRRALFRAVSERGRGARKPQPDPEAVQDPQLRGQLFPATARGRACSTRSAAARRRASA